MAKYTKGQTWGALKKAWKAYKIAKAQNDRERMKEYAQRIRTLQKELGLEQAKFPDLGLT
jgi:cobalamin biosynthesis Mg chelatase CobN